MSDIPTSSMAKALEIDDVEEESNFELTKLCPLLHDNEKLVNYLTEKGILKNEMRCGNRNCRRQMSKVKKTDRSDGFIWKCASCKSERSIRDGSYFAKSKLPLNKLLLLTYTWAFSIPAQSQAVLCGVSENTTTQWNSYLRDVCSTFLLKNPIKLGGEGVVCQIDESVMAHQKYHRGVPPSGSSRWVFGIIDVNTRLCHLEFVEDRSAATLIPIIQKHVLPGTDIWSDEWRSYSQLKNLGYQHHTVNHSKNFRDPLTGTCTNLIECVWKNAKAKFKGMVGTNVDMIPSYLDEFLWRERNGKKSSEAFENIMFQIGNLWPW